MKTLKQFPDVTQWRVEDRSIVDVLHDTRVALVAADCLDKADLIAAAPELLQALEALLQHDSAGGPCDQPGLKCECYPRARGAIAKARGGQ